jgi:aerobic-type carbon monoxide dehydrogenase small subunit (CoxS/CutS family)
MVCHALSNIHPDADNETIENWLQSNICRCTGYVEITEAMRQVLNRDR